MLGITTIVAMHWHASKTTLALLCGVHGWDTLLLVKTDCAIFGFWQAEAGLMPEAGIPDVLTPDTESKVAVEAAPAPSPEAGLPNTAETASYVVSLAGRLENVCGASDLARHRTFLG